MRLSLFVVDFHLEEAALEGGAASRLPALPALEWLLSQGRRLAPQPDWRAALLAEVGLPSSPAPSPARIAAGLLEGAPVNDPWFAQPVHRIAGMSHVSLHPAGLLRLSALEAQEWSTDLNAEFAASGLRFHALAPGLLLEGLPTGAQGAGEPARWLGTTLSAAAGGAAADRSLRRASAEIEMWLHGHPRNRERERRGELPLNGLWLWGGQGDGLPAATGAVPPPAFGEDPFLRGLWRLLDGTVQPAQRLGDLPGEAPSALVVQSAAPSSPGDLPLQRLESGWFAPVRDALQRRELRPLRLWIGGRGWEVAPSRLFRMRWRSLRPWWRQVAE